MAAKFRTSPPHITAPVTTDFVAEPTGIEPARVRNGLRLTVERLNHPAPVPTVSLHFKFQIRQNISD